MEFAYKFPQIESELVDIEYSNMSAYSKAFHVFKKLVESTEKIPLADTVRHLEEILRIRKDEMSGPHY